MNEDLAVAAILVTALLVALVCVLVAEIDPSFGAFVVILGVPTMAFATISEEWRFVPAAVAGGLIVDLIVRISPERWKAVAAGAGSAGAVVVGAALTVTVTSGRLGWSPTLLAGMVVASIFLGSFLAEIVGPTETGRVGDMTASPVEQGRATPIQAWFAWLALLFALWLVAGIAIVVIALDNGLTNDVGFSVYHIPFYLCLGSLAAISLVLVVRAVREGRRWTQAFPPGYGSLGAGLLVMVAYLFVDVGWREGVGIKSSGIESAIAPSRIILFVGVLLVLVAPLRATLRAGGDVNRWPAVVSTALVVGLVQPAGFHPAENPWLEHIRVGPSGEVWIMDADGSHQTRLITATDPFQPWNPTWSPDGREIAFTRVRVGIHSPDDDIADIWIADADGSRLRPVVEGDSYKWLPHWSPDGVYLVYTDEPAGGPWGTSVPRAEGPGGFLGPIFDPGRPTPVRQPAHIWRVRADGTDAPEQLTDVTANDRAATYSPDGSKLAFDSRRDGQTRVYVMDADGSDPRRVTDGIDDWGATWSPDGRSIAYKSSSGPGH